MNNLGYMYDFGQGVPQNYQKAKQWYEEAAALGNPGAMRNVGILYEDSRGVPRDYGQARE